MAVAAPDLLMLNSKVGALRPALAPAGFVGCADCHHPTEPLVAGAVCWYGEPTNPARAVAGVAGAAAQLPGASAMLMAVTHLLRKASSPGAANHGRELNSWFRELSSWDRELVGSSG